MKWYDISSRLQILTCCCRRLSMSRATRILWCTLICLKTYSTSSPPKVHPLTVCPNSDLNLFTITAGSLLFWLPRAYKKLIMVNKIVTAFWGMHVLPAKHNYAWLPRKCDYQTDGRVDRQTPDKVIPMRCYASQATQKCSIQKEYKSNLLLFMHYHSYN